MTKQTPITGEAPGLEQGGTSPIPSDITITSQLGYTYGLIDALRHNPTIINAGDNISARAIEEIRRLQIALADIADPERLESDGDPTVLRRYAAEALAKINPACDLREE